ncbi:MAG: hypothetical protein IPJ26_15785 [Bacteroidetes bacterium]|nr:hypothetical protein [Bacteroidota bacterium]
MERIILLILISLSELALSQGFNHHWLIGSQWVNTVPKGRVFIDSTSFSFLTEFRDMAFMGTDGSISDAEGNFLMSSNGVWIANANNDTMLNGTGLNPGSEVNTWPNGLILPYANVFLPFPGDTTKYALIHHSAEFNGQWYYMPEIFLTVIDINLDNGLGGVIQKNTSLIQGAFNTGIGTCKHANGRDWWIVFQRFNR